MSLPIEDFTPEELAEHRCRGELFERLRAAAGGAMCGDVFVAAAMLALDAGNLMEKPMNDATVRKVIPFVRDQLNDWTDNGGQTLTQIICDELHALPMAPGVN